MAAISSAKDELITPTELMQRALTSSDYAKRKQAEVYREYQEALHKNNALDFDDLIMKTVELLQSDPEVKIIIRNVFIILWWTSIRIRIRHSLS